MIRAFSDHNASGSDGCLDPNSSPYQMAKFGTLAGKHWTYSVFDFSLQAGMHEEGRSSWFRQLLTASLMQAASIRACHWLQWLDFSRCQGESDLSQAD